MPWGHTDKQMRNVYPLFKRAVDRKEVPVLNNLEGLFSLVGLTLRADERLGRNKWDASFKNAT